MGGVYGYSWDPTAACSPAPDAWGCLATRRACRKANMSHPTKAWGFWRSARQTAKVRAAALDECELWAVRCVPALAQA